MNSVRVRSRSYYDAIDQRADDAWISLTLKPDWSHWVAVGEAMLRGRERAMRDAETNQPSGRGYVQAFSAWLAERKFVALDGSDRSRLFECMENLVAIERWRATLPLTQRLRLNHPSSVLRKWKSCTVVPDVTKPKKATIREAHVAVIEENERLKQSIARGDQWECV